VSQVLLQRSLRPQQLRSQNENLIGQIRASELFVLRHFNHLSPPSLPEAQRIDHDDEPTYPPFTPLNEGEPHGRSTPSTPPFSESDVQEQAVVGNQGQKRIQERNTSFGSPENSLEALCDEEDGQSMASQNVVAQSCSNGRLAGVSTNETMRRQDKTASLPRHGVQTRSKSNHIVPSSLATSSSHGNNTPRNDESDTASATTGKGFLTKGPEILGSLWDKAGRAGREKVMREAIYDMIRTLRVGVMRERQDFNSETQKTTNPHLRSVLLQVPKGFSNFQALRQELEMSSVGEQLYRLRRRVALAQFYNDYTNAQADPHGFLYPNQNEELSMQYLTATRKRKRGAKKHGNRLATLVHNRIVDLMFPSLVLSDKDIESEGAEAVGEERVQKRKVASQKVKNWRANGRPWSALVKRFDWGILLLLPTDLSDQK